MFEGFLKMNIEEIKKDFKKMRMPKMDISLDEFTDFDNFVKKIKKQDRDDEKYVLHNKMFPAIFGLFFLTIIMFFTSPQNLLQFSGLVLCYTGLISMLVLMFVEYKNISKESYDLSLLAYLMQKEKRLKSWRSTPLKFQMTFIIMISGCIMLLIGVMSSISQAIVITLVYLVILFTSWLIGEYFYRKRHREKHLPLIKMISEYINELNKE